MKNLKRLCYLKNIDGTIFPYDKPADGYPSHADLIEAAFDWRKELAEQVHENTGGGYLYYIPKKISRLVDVVIGISEFFDRVTRKYTSRRDISKPGN